MASQYALEVGLCVAALSVVLTWPFAVASEKWIERPAIVAGRVMSAWVSRLLRKPQPVPSAVEQGVVPLR